jgi:hypothetical protein
MRDATRMPAGDTHAPVERFPLAPMSTDIRALTVIALLAPLGLGLAAALARGPTQVVLLVVSAAVLALYASVWLAWRPTAFEIDRDGLRIRWPLRTRLVAARDIVGAETLTRDAFRRDFGWAMRIGVGGLGGGFGWLYTPKGVLDFYISRTDRLVLVRRRAGRPLLVTPERDERFVAAVRAVSRA